MSVQQDLVQCVPPHSVCRHILVNLNGVIMGTSVQVPVGIYLSPLNQLEGLKFFELVVCMCSVS